MIVCPGFLVLKEVMSSIVGCSVWLIRGWIWYCLGCIGVCLGHSVFHSCGFQLQMYNCYYYEGDLVVIVVGASVGRGVRVSMFGGYIG